MKEITRYELGELLEKNYIYYLKRESKIVYVGQTINIMERLLSHLRNADKDFDSASYFPVDGSKEERNYIEAGLIIEHKPEYNKSLPVKAVDMGLIKEKDLPSFIPESMKEKFFVIKSRGVNCYDSSIIKEFLTHED